MPATPKIKTFDHLWIPSKRASPKLILVLHGRGDSYAGFEWLPSSLRWGEQVNFLLVNAPDPYGDGFSWYDLPPDQLPGIKRSALLLDTLMDELKTLGYRGEDTVLFGFSQGCLMALEWGGRTSHRLAGFVAVSGYCYDEKVLAQEFSPAALQSKWLVTHGTKDDLLPYARSEEQARYLKEKGLPLEFHGFPKEHTIDFRRELPLMEAWMETALKN